MLVSVGLATMLAAPPLVLAASAPTESATRSHVEDVDSFIVESDHNGGAACRLATHFEIPSTIRRPDDQAIPFKSLLKDRADQLQTQVDNASTGLTIGLDALTQLQNDPQKEIVIAAMERAAAVWENRIKSPITIRINIDYGVNLPDGEPFGANILGSTSSRRSLIDYPGVRTNLLASSSGAQETTLYNRLPTTFVATDIGNGGVVSVNRSVAFALGLPVAPFSDQTTVATMSFNKNFLFDFNPDDGITAGRTDFIAVAVHEIGHALGFTSGAGGGPTGIITLWDIYRFRPGTTTSTFTNAQRVMSIGGEQAYFTGETFDVEGLQAAELRLSTGGPDPKAGDGDLRQSSHWKDDALTGRFIGIMDPTIASGTHEEATTNDFLALETIGWNLISPVPPPPAPPPPPPPANNNFANAQVISGCSGSVGGNNIGATRENNEPNHSPDNGGGMRSVWYSWQAPSSGSVTITTTGSRFDTVLGVYTGSSVGSLSPVTQLDGTVGKDDDDEGGVVKTSTVTFNASAGTIYKIAVDGYDNDSSGDFGSITLNWSCTGLIELLLDQSGPAADQAAALDNILFLRDPFLVDNATNLFYTLGDRNTRVLLFVRNLQLPPGAASAVTINLVDSSNKSYNIVAQDLLSVPNQSMMQITFRLPDNLPAGTCKVKVLTLSQVSNTASFRIRTS